MISFENDYSTGAHPRILEALAATNLEPASGYGSDRFCVSARERIRAACDDPTADVFFLVGGTQANAVTISALLGGHEGVIAADTGHIAVHEAGAIEATGHKVLTLPEHDGKLRAADVAAYLDTFYADASFDHMVFPGMVFIAHPSELGTLYSLAELEELSALCRRANSSGPKYWSLAALMTERTLLGGNTLSSRFSSFKTSFTTRRASPTSPWPTSRGSATPSTSGAPSAAPSAARPWCSRAAACPSTSSPTPSSTGPCWRKDACSACSSTRYLPTVSTAR